MTWRKREIIDMAREAGMNYRTDVFYSEFCDGVYDVDLEAFAELVEKKATKKEQDRCCAIVFAQCDSDNVAQKTVYAIRGQA